MALPIIGKLIGGLIGQAPKIGDGISNIISKNTERIRTVSGDVAETAQAVHEENMAVLQSSIEEMRVTGGWIDTLTRIPRPLIACLTIAYLVYFVFQPVKGMAIAQAMASIPDSMWYIIMGVFGFYFTFRTIDKISDSRKVMSKADYEAILGRVTAVGASQSKAIQEVVKEHTKAIKDLNGDGLDDDLVERIKKEEGYSSKPYRCSKGFLTIGYGTNIDIGIEQAEAEFLLAYRIKKCQAEIEKLKPIVKELDNNRKNAIIDMSYNMGASNFAKWTTFFTCIEEKKYDEASKIIKGSKYAKEVKNRAARNAEIIEKG